MGALFGFTGSFDRGLFESMKDSLRHRGTQAYSVSNDNATIGYWSRQGQRQDPGCGAGLAQVPVKPARAPQNETSHSQDCLIGLAGFQTAGPTATTMKLKEIAASAIELSAPPANLSGDFVAAISSEESLTLIRDGAGSRTLYFTVLDGRLVFASEPKAIWSLKSFRRQLNHDSLLKYLTFSFVPEMPTMLENLFELPAGHTLCWDGYDYRIQRFFEFENVQSIATEATDHIGNFHQTFSRSVADRLELLDTDPVVFLSGGLDSSIVAAEIRAQVPGEIETYSLHFGEKYPNELSFAKEVADQLKTRHREVLMEPKQFLPDLRQMIWHLDDPIGDPITMPNYCLARHVSERTNFVFNGEGGDPCLGGPKNLPMMLTHWYGVERPKDFRELAYLESYRRAYEEVDRIFEPDFYSQTRKECLVEVLRPYFRLEQPNTLLEKLQLINTRLKGAHLILPKVERMLGAHQVSPLSPLFSSEVVQHSFALPPELKLSRGVEKIILKKIYKNQIPESVIMRPKSGMRVPVHFWFQGELKRYAKHVLSKKELRRAGIFNPARVKQLLDYNIEEGNGRYGIRLWMLLTFEIWRRLVLENEPL